MIKKRTLYYKKVKCDGPTEGPTDGPTDGRTDGWTDIPSYRDARTHLKTIFCFRIKNRNQWPISSNVNDVKPSVFLFVLCLIRITFPSPHYHAIHD